MATRANLPPITSLHKITHISRPAPRPAVTRGPACRRGRGGSLGVLPRNKAASVRRLGRGKIAAVEAATTQHNKQNRLARWRPLAPRSGVGWMGWDGTSASKSSIRRFVITEKAPTRAFSWLKAATTAFTFKTLFKMNKNLCLLLFQYFHA